MIKIPKNSGSSSVAPLSQHQQIAMHTVCQSIQKREKLENCITAFCSSSNIQQHAHAHSGSLCAQ
eukprot:18441-Heterococcus_DN1.PRE.1